MIYWCYLLAAKEHAAQWLSNLIEVANELTTSSYSHGCSCFLEVLVAPPKQQNHVHTKVRVCFLPLE